MGWIWYGSNCTVYDPILVTIPMLALGVTSDVASIIGSSLIIITFFVYRDIQTRARQLLLFISISDFFNAGSYLFGQSWSLHNLNFSGCYAGKPLYEISFCVGQATLTVFFTLSCYTFTMLLSFHVLFLLAGRNIFKKKIAFSLAVLLGWAIPFVITLVGLLPGWLGPGRSVTVGTCFIRNFGSDSSSYTKDTLIELFIGRFWDIFTFVVISFVYTISVCLLYRRRKLLKESSFISQQDLKLILIPIAFLVFRIWAQIHLIFMYNQKIDFFMYLQAIFDPGQGWANFIIYVIFTKSVRSKFRLCRRGKSRRKRLPIYSGRYDDSDPKVRSMDDFSSSAQVVDNPYRLYKD